MNKEQIDKLEAINKRTKTPEFKEAINKKIAKLKLSDKILKNGY